METVRSRWVVPALAGLVLVSLGVGMAGGFVWDDRPLIVESSRVKDVARLGEILTTGFWETADSHDRFRAFFRPLVSSSYALDHAIWGLSPVGFHLTNLLLHFACTLLVLRICRDAGLDVRAAFCGAALFAVHPVHVESVAWISGRTDLLATLFLLVSFAAFTRGEVHRGWRWVSWVCFLAALFSKEAAAPLPAIVFVAVWVRAKPRTRLREAISASLPFFLVLALYAIVRTQALGGGTTPLYDLEPLAWVATALFVAARYLTLMILPLGLDAHYPYQPLTTLLDARVAVAVGMLALVGFGLYRLARINRRALLWPAWIALALTPVLTFGRFGDVLLADRFVYLPSVGLCVLAACGAQAVLDAGSRRWTTVAAGSLAVALVLLSAATFSRSLVWDSDERLFSDMLKTSPSSALVHNNLGRALYERDEIVRAIEHFERAVEIAPGYSQAHNNLAAGLHATGRTDEALLHYNEALRLSPGLMMAGANGGHLLVELGHVREGLEILRETARLHPDAPVALFAYSDALHLAGRSADALVLLDRIALIDAAFPSAYYLRGKIYSDAGRLDVAAREMETYLDLWDSEDRTADRARAVIARAAAS
jgi:Flp pilus assembly protein TadD